MLRKVARMADAGVAEFSFGQVEALLARHNRIAEHKRAAFVSRIKFLQKHGVPHCREKTGRGKSAAFTFSEVVQLAAAIELLQSGLTPQKAARIISTNWIVLEPTVSQAIMSGPLHKNKRLMTHWILHLSELSELMSGDLADYDLATVFCVDVDHLTEIITGKSESDTFRDRLHVVNGSYVVSKLAEIATRDLAFCTREQIWNSLVQEEQREADRVKELWRVFDDNLPNWKQEIYPQTNEPLGDEFVAWLNVRRFETSDSRFMNPAYKHDAQMTVRRLSRPARDLLNYIALTTWGRPRLGADDLNAVGGLFIEAPALRWSGEIDDLYFELIKHELLSEPEGDRGPGLTTLGSIATLAIAKLMAQRTRDAKKNGKTEGEAVDVSSEA